MIASRLKLGTCNYPEQWPVSYVKRDAKRMKEMGLSYVRLDEFAWSKMEPEHLQFQWQWLDDVIEILCPQGLNVILSTPTAAPPKWLVDAHPEIVPLDEFGHPH